MIMAASHTNNVVTDSNSNTKIKQDQDDDVCDSWEQIDECALEKRLQSKKLENKKIEEENSSRNNPIRIMTNPASQQQQQQPQSFKILKRPPSSKQLNGTTPCPVNVQPAQPIKTFEQREQEYAQARLRILGSAHPAEEKTNDNTSNQDSNTNVGNNNDNSHSRGTSNNSKYYGNYNNNNNNNINLVRDPIAPDGTRGFNHSNSNNSNFNNNT